MLVVKNLPANAGDVRDLGLIPGLGRSPGGGQGNRLQYSCLENATDGGAWWATVPRIAKSRTRLKEISMHACIINYTHQGGRIWHQNDLIEEKYIYGFCQLNSWM